MPQGKWFGDRALVDGPRRVQALPATPSAQPPIAADRWARNQQHPNSHLMNSLNEAANQGIMFRSKQVFSWYSTIIPEFPAGTSDEVRYNWAFKTGPYCHALYAVVAMLPPGGAIPYWTSTSSRCDITTTGGSLAASTTFDYGPNPKMGAITPDAWPHLKVLTKYITGIDPSTEYTGQFTTQGGRIQSACVFELPSLTQNDGGYLTQGITSQSSMLDVYREDLIGANNKLWRGGGAHVLNWTTETGTTSYSSSTTANLIDTSITTVDAASPGYTLDMRKKGRIGRSVPVVMKVLAQVSSVADPGDVTLVDSSGATVLQITGAWSSLGPTWASVVGTLPATEDKYDLRVSNGGSGTIYVSAVSIYEDDPA